jgi:hypothetical protein
MGDDLIKRIRRTQADCADSLAAADLIEQQAARIAALESAEKENGELLTALAECRDAFPVPAVGGELEGHWVSAMANPDEVPAYVKACIESAEKEAVPVAWEPIETAPKTGRTLILGYINSAGKWRTTRGQWMSEAYIAEQWEDPDDAEPGWYETSVEADDAPNCWPIMPTHWMPLPAAPAALSQKAGE